MSNQVKLLLVVVALGILGILFFQNQEPISLKLLCADTASQYCWYQTPTLPLAIWIGLFLVVGVISSLSWQFLQNLGSPRRNYGNQSSPNREKEYSTTVVSPSTKKNSKANSYPTSNSPSDWEYSEQGENWESQPSKVSSKIEQDNTFKNSSFDVEQESQNMSQSDSTYSYKFKKSQKPEDLTSKSKNEVYDANYRAINIPKNSDLNENPARNEDEEDWI